MAETVERDRAPLDEVMLAMDVVDTLRHRELLIERELGADGRDQRLMQRLREIYVSQGIDVSDEVLSQGVRALREDRFTYTPPAPGPARSLALLYVTRRGWGRRVAAVILVLAAVLLAYQFLIRGPALRAVEALPAELRAAHQSVVDIAAEPGAVSEAHSLAQAGEAAIAREDLGAAREALEALRDLRMRLEQEYELRVVSRPGELSGVWRVPDVNASALNYYLIVEAVTPDGMQLTVPVRNEEDGRIEEVSQWGLRVDEQTFRRVADDKQDDGIIQNAVVGVKARGVLETEYRVPTSGAAITEW